MNGTDNHMHDFLQHKEKLCGIRKTSGKPQSNSVNQLPQISKQASGQIT